MTCEKCKYYETSAVLPHLGWCDLMLPVWLHRATNTEYEVNRTVRVDDSCSFGETK